MQRTTAGRALCVFCGDPIRWNANLEKAPDVRATGWFHEPGPAPDTAFDDQHEATPWTRGERSAA